MQVTKHYCDLCGKEITMEGNRIQLRVDFHDDYRCGESIYCSYSEVCDNCLFDMGFKSIPKEPDETIRERSNLGKHFKSIVTKLVSMVNSDD